MGFSHLRKLPFFVQNANVQKFSAYILQHIILKLRSSKIRIGVLSNLEHDSNDVHLSAQTMKPFWGAISIKSIINFLNGIKNFHFIPILMMGHIMGKQNISKDHPHYLVFRVRGKLPKYVKKYFMPKRIKKKSILPKLKGGRNFLATGIPLSLVTVLSSQLNFRDRCHQRIVLPFSFVH